MTTTTFASLQSYASIPVPSSSKAVVDGGRPATGDVETALVSPTPRTEPAASSETRGAKVKSLLRSKLGEDVYTSWFQSLEFESFDAGTVRMTVPVKFLRNWIQSHYAEDLLAFCKIEFEGCDRVEVNLRQPGRAIGPREGGADAGVLAADAGSRADPGTAVVSLPSRLPPPPAARSAVGGSSRIPGGLDGSPLDPRSTFDTFVVGVSNRMAHAAAQQVAETVQSGSRSFNPLFIHASVGHGKTHLLQAIAWEVKRRAPHALVLYLTAERFRFQFVEALRNQDAMAFKDRFRHVDILLIDDLEFMHGQQTEQEFDHIINAFLDGGKQVVVASSRAPNQIERLNERMRSRMQRGLVTEIGALDHELRLRVLEQRMMERRSVDPGFHLSRDILEMLAERLTESGRELEGAITRLQHISALMKSPITLDIAETVIRDLVAGSEPRRVKIEDILKVVARRFGVTRADLLSQRRHRSVVWPRQIGMYLAKQLTARSLPEIGRRFGNRDHTTVLHAIRKIDGQLTTDLRLKDELEELKKMLNT